ncbi:P-loop containing nucleoside triphosphate hydrolase protein [Hypoxylon sp. NC0597]|nr:P-loop containing nucleoside triphosphate hydrolase protein [Hypoxylon sp. NC0597]
MAPSGSPPSFGSKLPQFFQEAYALVQGDLDTLQKTVTEFATEQAVLAVRELVDERILFCHTDPERVTLWRTCIQPFFQILTEPRVVRSAILEVHTGTIYNVVFGHNAARLEVLFNFLIDLAAKWQPPLFGEDDGSKSQFLELCAAILAKTVDCNTQVLVNEAFPRIVDRLRDSIDDLDQGNRNFWILQATNHLAYIQRRLGLVKGVAQNAALKPQPCTHATFILRRDLPGMLSTKGPRHDNDFEDIAKIRILPTMSELMSTREDYRPFHDPSQLHLPGIEGQIDRHFRLLREDMVGQLKECISEELGLLKESEDGSATKQQKSLRTHSYNVVDITDITCTRRCGIEFHLKIEQPFSASKLTSEAREDWWNMSKRLEIGALVCLLVKDTAVFCVVSESTIRPNQLRKYNRRMSEAGEATGKHNLYSNKDFAYVNLNLAEPSDADLRTMLRVSQSGEFEKRSLVEFPGVLLPSFKPTLSALQQLSKTLDLPFTDLLAPISDGPTRVTIPMPLYATKPGFAFNLKCLTSDNSDLLFSPRDTPDPNELCFRSSLDKGQAIALLNSLKRSLALIQGPPGTGKSYTGEAIIKVLLANKERAEIGPILCVCYTNHALDQLLEHLWYGGVKQIIRIGSRSKSSILEDVNLRRVSKDMERTKSEKSAAWKSASVLGEAEKEMKEYLAKLRDSGIAQNVKRHIETEAAPFHEAIFGVEDDGWTKVTYLDEKAHFLKWIDAGSLSEEPTRDVAVLKRQQPETLSRQERSLLCAEWASEVAASLEDEFISLHDDHHSARQMYEAVIREVDLRVLQEADIVGVTTTGLAKNLDMLRKLDAKVLVCEEAGEVLESHILTALLPSVEHAILIGDHLQLRPQVTNYDLSVANPRGEQYSLDVSLFERLVQPTRPADLKLPFDMLTIQRRMHPSISSLTRKTMYSTLRDAERVKDYPEVTGMRKRLFWFDHDKQEARSDPNHLFNTSRTNDFEVEMVCALVSHLVRQGVYGREDIAILTPYLGQLHKLRNKLRNLFEVAIEDRDLEDLHKEGLDAAPQVFKQSLGNCVRLATVDNFQGEEAKIVVISLVRSNQERQCGFLKTTNRINVLLSRAKHGMYILGNSSTYGAVEMWSKVVGMLKENGNIGTRLPLQCPRHRHTPIEVSELDDFVRLSPEAGCNVQCSQRLDCGHTCLSKCHATTLHKAVKCLEPCQRLKEKCGHGCPRTCGEPCEEECSTVLKGQMLHLPCGHSLISPQCWQAQAPSKVRCYERVTKTVPGCNHRVQVPCREDVTKDCFICQTPCGQILSCGHACEASCKACRTRVNGEVVAEKHEACTSICGRNYSTCKHACSQKCHPGKNCPPCGMPCEEQCSHSKCPKTCSEPCTPCAMAKCSSTCPHSECTMPCAAPCNWIPCSKRCGQFLSCGHQCPSICGEVCPDPKYCQVCASDDVKSTVVDMLELREYREVNLDEDPCIFPHCGHMMIMSSMDSQLGMSNHYRTADDGTIIAIKTSPTPLSDNVIKVCPQCRGSLRNLSRYGRLVRQALLDESTKRFISWSHSQSMAFERRLINEQERLEYSQRSSQTLELMRRDGVIYIIGSLVDEMLGIHDWIENDRYRPVIELYFEIFEYLGRVRAEEQPYKRVFDLVEHARQTGGVAEKFELDSAKIQTRGQLLAQAMLIRCNLVVMADFLQLRRDAQERFVVVHINVERAIEECEKLVTSAHRKKYARQEVEGRIFHAKIVAIARELNVLDGPSNEVPVPDSVVTRAKHHISEAEALILENPLTAYLRKDLSIARRMLYQGVFYEKVSVEEKRAICEAMAQEFTGTGHWYTCAHGHPFTVADCGLPMEATKCPECGAPVGGHDHELAAGVELRGHFALL